VIPFVHQLGHGLLVCPSVHPVSIASAQVPPCSRAVYYEHPGSKGPSRRVCRLDTLLTLSRLQCKSCFYLVSWLT